MRNERLRFFFLLLEAWGRVGTKKVCMYVFMQTVRHYSTAAAKFTQVPAVSRYFVAWTPTRWTHLFRYCFGRLLYYGGVVTRNRRLLRARVWWGSIVVLGDTFFFVHVFDAARVCKNPGQPIDKHTSLYLQ